MLRILIGFIVLALSVLFVVFCPIEAMAVFVITLAGIMCWIVGDLLMESFQD